MAETYVTGETLVGEIVTQYPEAIEVLLSIGMHCLGCPASRAESPALCTACLWIGCSKPSTPKSPKRGKASWQKPVRNRTGFFSAFSLPNRRRLPGPKYI